METAADRRFTGPIPELYERLFVPLLFEGYAADLADRVAALRPRRLLETAAGTGVLTRALRQRLPDADITASDLNQPMLDRAMRAGVAGPVHWQQVDAAQLPFDDASFDVVACQFGVMFFPDKVQAFAEAWRVLRPEGVLAFNVWDRLEENEFAHAVSLELTALYPQDPPRFMQRTPHGYFELDRIRQDLAAAGFRQAPEVQTVAARSRAASAAVPAMALCQGTPLRAEIEARAPGGLEEATEACARRLASQFGHGAVDGRIQAHVILQRR